ncbi:Uncharacterised protein [Mycobacteroides abscessus subsp. abscessus]|nr:Uncharacterised protein [Mycobacteroides abscessus subsp. abscessus]
MTFVSRTTSPPPPGSSAVESGSSATSFLLYSPGSRSMPSADTISLPSSAVRTLQFPALTALMTRCTSLPRRGPAARALTASS